MNIEVQYLGSTLNEQNWMTQTIQQKLIAGNKAYYATQCIMKSQTVGVKAKVYKSFIKLIETTTTSANL